MSLSTAFRNYSPMRNVTSLNFYLPAGRNESSVASTIIVRSLSGMYFSTRFWRLQFSLMMFWFVAIIFWMAFFMDLKLLRYDLRSCFSSDNLSRSYSKVFNFLCISLIISLKSSVIFSTQRSLGRTSLNWSNALLIFYWMRNSREFPSDLNISNWPVVAMLNSFWNALSCNICSF